MYETVVMQPMFSGLCEQTKRLIAADLVKKVTFEPQNRILAISRRSPFNYHYKALIESTQNQSKKDEWEASAN
jgi:hypothetical protein